jgi:hypothetical protein
VFGLRGISVVVTGFLVAVACQPERLVRMTAVVPRYRCGAAPDSHRIPIFIANYQM